MKRTFLSLVAGSGGFVPFRAAHRRRALVVTYHRFTAAVTADSPAGALPADALAAHLEYLTRHYRVVPLYWLASRIQRGEEIPSSLAAITVDDGYADVCEVALPVFQRFRVPATVFVVSGFLDGMCWIWTDKIRHVMAQTPADRLDAVIGGQHLSSALDTPAARRAAAARVNRLLKSLPDATKDTAIEELEARLGVRLPVSPPPGVRPLTWPQARVLVAAGIDIGSHTVTHPMLTHVGAERLAYEVDESRRRLQEALSIPIHLFCYPNGGFDDRARASVARAGYTAAVSTIPGFNDGRTDSFALRRIHAEHTMAHFIQSTSGFEQFKTRIRAAGAPRRVPRGGTASASATAER